MKECRTEVCSSLLSVLYMLHYVALCCTVRIHFALLLLLVSILLNIHVYWTMSLHWNALLAGSILYCYVCLSVLCDSTILWVPVLHSDLKNWLVTRSLWVEILSTLRKAFNLEFFCKHMAGLLVDIIISQIYCKFCMIFHNCNALNYMFPD